MFLLLGGGVGAVLSANPAPGDSQRGHAYLARGAAPAGSQRVASFAVRAIAHAQLMDREGTFYNYEGITADRGAWIVHFGAGDVRVEMRDMRYAVTDASGNMSAEQRDRVRGYREDAGRETSEFQFPNVEIRSSEWDTGASVVSTSELWTGGLAQLHSRVLYLCHVEVFDSSGRSVYVGSDMPLPIPDREELRAGSLIDFGITEPVEDPADATVTCRSE